MQEIDYTLFLNIYRQGLQRFRSVYAPSRKETVQKQTEKQERVKSTKKGDRKSLEKQTGRINPLMFAH